MAKAENLTYDFTSKDTDNYFWYGGANVSIVDGQLQMLPTTNYASVSGYTSYDLTDSHMGVEFVQNCNEGNGSITTEFIAKIDADNYVEFLIGGGGDGASFVLRETVAGVHSDISIAYSTVAHRWLRFREDSGTVFWETSPDGAVWTVRRSKASTLDVSGVIVQFVCGRWSAEPSPGATLFDNLGLLNGNTVVSELDLAEDLSESFDSENAALWVGYGSDIAAREGELRLTPSDTLTTLESLESYNLVDSYYAVELTSKGPSGNGSFLGHFGAYVDADNYVSFMFDGGDAGYISFREISEGVESQEAVDYRPLRHRWLRLRESSGTVYWETSHDGAYWVVRRSKAVSMDLSSTRLRLSSEFYETEPDPGLFTFDNVNLVGGTTVGPELPLPASYFTDDFSSLNNWVTAEDGSVSLNSGRVEFDLGDVGTEYGWMVSVDRWDLTGSSIMCQVVQNANRGTSEYVSTSFELIARVDEDNSFRFVINGGEFAPMECRETVDGVNSATAKSFDADRHYWIRLREDSGTLYWETSFNSTTWTVQRSKESAIDVSSIEVGWSFGFWDETESDPGVVLIDNLNLPDVSILRNMGWHAGSLSLGGEDGGTVQLPFESLLPRSFFDEADWLWDPIPEDPVLDPYSAEIVADSLTDGGHYPAGWEFGVTVVRAERVTSETPRYIFQFPEGTGPSPVPFEVPVPDDVEIAPPPLEEYGDGHLVIVDPTVNRVYDFWAAEKIDGVWHAGWGGFTDLHGEGFEADLPYYVDGVYQNDIKTTAVAARWSRLAAIPLLSEMLLPGDIEHALFFAARNTPRIADHDDSYVTGFRYPARRNDGTNPDDVDHPIEQGARVQLDPSIDLAAIPGITVGELKIGRALQTYGAYCGDSAGATMGFIMEYPEHDTVPGTGYASIGFDGVLTDMTHIPWESLRVLKHWHGGETL